MLEEAASTLDGVDRVEPDVPCGQVPPREPVDALPVEAVVVIVMGGQILEGHPVGFHLDGDPDLAPTVEHDLVAVDPRMVMSGRSSGTTTPPG